VRGIVPLRAAVPDAGVPCPDGEDERRNAVAIATPTDPNQEILLRRIETSICLPAELLVFIKKP
jgi:hypothetical protein